MNRIKSESLVQSAVTSIQGVRTKRRSTFLSMSSYSECLQHKHESSFLHMNESPEIPEIMFRTLRCVRSNHLPRSGHCTQNATHRDVRFYPLHNTLYFPWKICRYLNCLQNIILRHRLSYGILFFGP
jgi:hypothetical protein